MRDETNGMRDEINGMKDGKVGLKGKESNDFNSPNNFMPSSQAFENNENKIFPKWSEFFRLSNTSVRIVT